MQYMPRAGLTTSLFAMQTQEKNQLSEAGRPILLSQLSLYIQALRDIQCRPQVLTIQTFHFIVLQSMSYSIRDNKHAVVQYSFILV